MQHRSPVQGLGETIEVGELPGQGDSCLAAGHRLLGIPEEPEDRRRAIMAAHALRPTRFAHIHRYGKYEFNVAEAQARKGLRPLRAWRHVRYSGSREDPASHTIFGKDVLAVADAKVVSVIDDLPEQTPGTFPSHIPLEEADGNSIVLDLGGGRYGLYAHLRPGSIKVHPGDTVKRGQVIALVGNSGNSIAPHLHFHVMSTPSPLASNGLPYEIDAFKVTGTSPSTAAFDAAEAHGTPLTITPISPPTQVVKGMPLDQLLIAFPGR